MITNATLTSVTTPPTFDGNGRRTPGVTSSIDVRAFVDEPRQSQLIALANRVKDITGVVYVPDASTDLGELAPESRLVYRLDGGAIDHSVQVLHVMDRVKAGGLSHREIYVKGF